MIKIIRGTSLDDATAIHATAIEIDDSVGVLIVGPSGSGKSDLALRLIDRGARLVADDVVELKVEEGRLVASPSSGWLGLMEVRGIGIMAMPAVDQAEVARVIGFEDLPHEIQICGVSVPTTVLQQGDLAAPIRVELSVNRFHRQRLEG